MRKKKGTTKKSNVVNKVFSFLKYFCVSFIFMVLCLLDMNKSAYNYKAIEYIVIILNAILFPYVYPISLRLVNKTSLRSLLNTKNIAWFQLRNGLIAIIVCVCYFFAIPLFMVFIVFYFVKRSIGNG
ncbi:hypothetical protein QF51_25995 [Salmonella enterica subsp. diarizonae]|nr:hypothetical protein [Salmonella enterica subsp. diarizonae]